MLPIFVYEEDMNMSDESIFAQALSNFTKNFAYGDAIRHLVDKGYTTNRIIREFNYPITRQTIDGYVTERLIGNVRDQLEKDCLKWAYIREISTIDVPVNIRNCEKQDSVEVTLWTLEDIQDAFKKEQMIKSEELIDCAGRKIQSVRIKMPKDWLTRHSYEESFYVNHKSRYDFILQ